MRRKPSIIKKMTAAFDQAACANGGLYKPLSPPTHCERCKKPLTPAERNGDRVQSEPGDYYFNCEACKTSQF